MTQEFLSRTGYRPVQSADLTSASISDFTEAAQDAIGSALLDTTTIDLTYSDGVPSITADLKDTTVVAGTYGSSTAVGTFIVDAQGRLTAASDIAIDLSGIDDFITALYYVAAGSPRTIPVYKQMVVAGGSLILEDSLVVDGQLYVEA
jgi:hypothetical protein